MCHIVPSVLFPPSFSCHLFHPSFHAWEAPDRKVHIVKPPPLHVRACVHAHAHTHTHNLYQTSDCFICFLFFLPFFLSFSQPLCDSLFTVILCIPYSYLFDIFLIKQGYAVIEYRKSTRPIATTKTKVLSYLTFLLCIFCLHRATSQIFIEVYTIAWRGTSKNHIIL